MRKPYATLLCLLLSAALWAQPDSANLHYRQGRTEAKLELLEERLKEQKKTLNEKLERQHSELAERLEVKNENLQFKMTQVNWLIAIFGIAVPILITIAGFFIGKKIYKDISKDKKEFEEKAQEHLKTLEGYVAEGKSKCDSIGYSSEPTEENKAENIEKAQEVQKDKNASPLDIDEAEANKLYFSEKHQKAIDKFENILIKYNDELTKPQLEDIYFRMAYSHSKLNEREKALELYSTTLTLNPKNYVAWNNKGYLLMNMGEEHFPQAQLCYDRAIELRPELSQTHFNKGSLLEKMGESNEKVLACFEEALCHNPNGEQTKINIKRIKGKMKGK